MAKLKSSARAKRPAAGKKEAGLQAKAEQMSRSIVDSAQQIWLAGVGAFGRAQEEGTKLFEALVKEGMNLEKTTRHLTSGKVDAVRDAVEERVGQVRERATDTWDRLEKVFEQRVQRAMTRLGVPSREEVKALIDRVDELNAELRKLSKGAPAASGRAAKPVPRKPAKKAPAKKAAAKKAPAKRIAAGKPARKKPSLSKVAKPTAPGSAG